MMIDVRAPSLAPVCVAPRPSSTKMAVSSNTYAFLYPSASSRMTSRRSPRMSTTTSVMQSAPTTELSWKPPWDARRETSGILTGVGYDTAVMDRFFEHRPERALHRTTQIFLEVGGVLLAFVEDRFSSAVAVADKSNSGEEGAVGVAAERIRRAVIRLGPNFVKIGQALASRPDLVGEAIAGELLLLQDAMPPFSNEVAREFIRQELGAYPEHIFQSIDDDPVAAASLGQVYKAWVDEQPVAVKVQRPDLLEAVALDFYLARGIATAITRLSQGPGFFGGRLAVRSDLVAAVDEYGSRLFEELDYRNEAQNMVRFRELYGSMPGVVVPRVLLDYSAGRVITSEWIDGEKLVDDQAQVSPADLPILRVGIDCTLTQLLDKGFLHADPHGGNLLKTGDKQLAYLDFGLVSVMPPGVMDALICATVQVMNRDYIALAKGFPALALMSEGDLAEDFAPFAEALRNALDPIVADFRKQMGMDGGFGNEAPSGSERVAFAQLIDRVFLLARSFNFRVPPYFISNVRALGELEGLAMTADPGFNLISVVYPYVCRRLLSDPSPPLRAALGEFAITEDGSVRWEVLEALMRDSNMLDERVGPGGESSRRPLDLSLEFLLSEEGTFIRTAAAADLRRTAIVSLKAKIAGFLGNRRRPSGATAPSMAETNRVQSATSKGDAIPVGEGDEVVRDTRSTGTARDASRRKLRRRLLKGAKEKPMLAARVAAAVATAAGRAAGMAVLRSFRGLLRRRRHRATPGALGAATA